MRNLKPKAILVLTLLGILALPAYVIAQSSGMIQGVAGAGSSATGIRPALVSGLSGSTNVPFAVNASGALSTTISAIDSGSVARSLKSDGSGTLYVTQGRIGPQDTYANLTLTASNGGTAVVLVAASGGVRVYVGSVIVTNASTTVAHTVQLISSGGTLLAQGIVPASGTGVFGENGGLFASALGEGLSFKFTDGTGSVTDCSASGVTVTK